MHNPLLGIVLLVSAICIGCSQNHLTTEVVGVPPMVNTGQKIRLQVRVHNRSKALQSLPYREIVLRTTRLKFVPGIVPKHPTSIDYPLSMVSLDICPPGFDWIEPGGDRGYDFTWTPESGDNGPGAFYVSLPITIPPIPPLPMTITNRPNK